MPLAIAMLQVLTDGSTSREGEYLSILEFNASFLPLRSTHLASGISAFKAFKEPSSMQLLQSLLT
jgi:hypothetical protein